MAASLLLALASAAPGDPTCLPGFKRFEDKCVTTVDTGFGRSWRETLNMMDCAATCGSLARPYVADDPLAAAQPLCIGSQAEEDFIQTSLIDEDGHAAVWLNFLRVDDDGNDWAGREATESFSAAPDAPWGKRRFLGAGGCSNEWVDAALAVDEGGLLQGGFAGNPALSVAPWADGEPYDLWGVGNEGCLATFSKTKYDRRRLEEDGESSDGSHRRQLGPSSWSQGWHDIRCDVNHEGRLNREELERNGGGSRRTAPTGASSAATTGGGSDAPGRRTGA